jgi:hypothetical protein
MRLLVDRSVVTGILALSVFSAAPKRAVGQVSDGDTPSRPWVVVDIPDRDVYHRRDRIPVAFRSERDGYAIVLRVDTDGRVRILYPASPADDAFVRGGQEYRVPNPYGYDVAHAFAVDDYPGVGYVFAVVSSDAFDYLPYVRNGHLDYRTIGVDGRITGDPYVALGEIVEYMLPPGYGTYAFDVAEYFVGARFEYPRFVCYDCHAYTAYPVWDPYRNWCGTFKLVIYDEPAWYPTTVYPATHVVPAGGTVVHPQFVIEGRTATEPHVVRMPGSGRSGATVEPGVRGRDLGGVGAVKAPQEREAGGIGGLIRRLFGGDDTKRRPEVGDPAPQRGEPSPPKLERRKKEGSAPGAGTPSSGQSSGVRRQPASRSGSQPRANPAAAPSRRPPSSKQPARPKTDRRRPTRGTVSNR